MVRDSRLVMYKPLWAERGGRAVPSQTQLEWGSDSALYDSPHTTKAYRCILKSCHFYMSMVVATIAPKLGLCSRSITKKLGAPRTNCPQSVIVANNLDPE